MFHVEHYREVLSHVIIPEVFFRIKNHRSWKSNCLLHLKGAQGILNLLLTQRRFKLALALLLLASLSLQLFAGLRTGAAQTTIPDTGVIPYGVNTFLDKEVEFWKKERTMQMISESGVKWIKQIFAWN